MNKTISWVIAIVVVVGLGYFLITKMPASSGTTGGDATSSGEGQVTVSFTDATTNISGVSEVSLGVNKVELYSQTKGWVTVSGDSAQYQLLDLHAKGQTKVYASAKVAADTYSRARVTLGTVTVHTTAGANKVAAVPSKTLDLEGSVVVKDTATTSLKFDVLADQSIHTTAKGEYVFAPVVKVESRSNASVTSDTDGVVSIGGGSVDTNSTVGMDLDGTVKANFKVDTAAKLNIDSSGVVSILGGATNSSSASVKGGNTDTGASVEGGVKALLK